MKNSRLVLFFAALLIALPTMATLTDPGAASPGIFQKIGDWLQGGAVGMAVVFLFGLMAKQGWSLLIKKIANKGAAITKEVGELFSDSSVFLATLDTAIKDDGTIEQNSVKELISAGKEVIAEGKDVIISIKPKI